MKKFTKIQLEVEKICNNIGFQTELETRFGTKNTDIYIHELHMVVEVDGPNHISKKVDRERDDYLKDNFGLNIIHINWKELRNKDEKQKVRSKILRFAEELSK